jgi:hypothetical protein
MTTCCEGELLRQRIGPQLEVHGHRLAALAALPSILPLLYDRVDDDAIAQYCSPFYPQRGA